jgi:AcrR family transcriptional regulator
MPKGIPLTQEEQLRKRRLILSACLPLFLQKSFHEVSLQDIAAAAGMGKSSLYDYFSTKDEILVFIVEEEVNELTHLAGEILARPLDATAKLRAILMMNLDYILRKKNLNLSLTMEITRIDPLSQQRIQQLRYTYQDMLRDLIAAGIAEGTFRPVDPLLAMRIIFNSLTAIAYTSRPSASPVEMLQSALDLMLYGLKNDRA